VPAGRITGGSDLALAQRVPHPHDANETVSEQCLRTHLRTSGLPRNLGLITGASAIGAVFALASATIDITTARPEAVATGMRITFAVAAILIVVALAIAVGAYRGTLHKRALAPEMELQAEK
jgi:hypothetical protein